MNVADGSRSQGEVPARQAALVIRGVGDAVPNEAVSQLQSVLEHYGISQALEVNWSWTELIEWPYAEGSSAAEKGQVGNPPVPISTAEDLNNIDSESYAVPYIALS